MEVGESDPLMKEVLGNFLDEGWGDVDAHELNSFENANISTGIAGEPCNGLNRAVMR